MSSFKTYFGLLSVKDPTFGAVGDGSHDDTAAIQAAFDAAFGTAASPHGNTNRFLNVGVFFPAGSYKITAPLYLTHVVGGKILGAGMNCTRLEFSGSLNGNTVIANGITPVIMTNGFAYSSISDINISISGADTTGLYLFENGTQGSVIQNTFINILFESAVAGALIGYQANANCSEQTFINCSANSCTYGFRNILQNALNNIFVGCGAAQCTTGFSCVLGGVHIYGASLANNTADIVIVECPVTILGGRTESANALDLSAATNIAHACVSGFLQDNSVSGNGYFANMGLGNLIADGCTTKNSGASTGLISGSTGKVYLRGNTFANASYISGYSGTVSQNI